jgi:proline iminopeptidase
VTTSTADTPTRGTERRLPIRTDRGTFEVWTEQVGDPHDGPVLLLLHGGPGATHEYLRTVDDHLPAAGVSYVHYDQLGSGRSDVPDEPSLWELDRFVDELDQVLDGLRDAGAAPGGVVVYGQSWGGLLAMEHAARHAERGDLADRVRGLVLSNMMASIPAYNAFAREVLMPAMDQDALAEIQRMEAEGRTEEPAYAELLLEHHDRFHLCRLPVEEWPPHVVAGLEAINRDIYVPLQGPSELGSVGKLERWDRFEDLARVDVPTLVMGAEHDTMDPAHLRAMADRLPQGRYHHSPRGSHLALVDDEATYAEGLLAFLAELGATR